MAFGTPPQMHGYQTPSHAQPQSFIHPPQTSLWQTSGRALINESYIPYDENAMRRQQAYMMQQQQHHAIMQMQMPHMPNIAQHHAPNLYGIQANPNNNLAGTSLTYLQASPGAVQHHPLHNSFEQQCSLQAQQDMGSPNAEPENAPINMMDQNGIPNNADTDEAAELWASRPPPPTTRRRPEASSDVVNALNINNANNNKFLEMLASTICAKPQPPKTKYPTKMPSESELTHAKSLGDLEIPHLGPFFSAIFTLLADHAPERADAAALSQVFYGNPSMNYSSWHHFIGRHHALAELDAYGARLLQAAVNATTAKGITFNNMRNEATQIEPLKNSAVLLMMLIRNVISIRSPSEEDSAEANFNKKVYFKAGQSAAEVKIAGIALVQELESIPTLNSRRGAHFEFLIKKIPESCDARKMLMTQFQTLRAVGFVPELGSPPSPACTPCSTSSRHMSAPSLVAADTLAAAVAVRPTPPTIVHHASAHSAGH